LHGRTNPSLGSALDLPLAGQVNHIYTMERINNLKKLYERRKDLRTNPTQTEEILWEYLRNKKLGVKFRRQHSIGGYILDFYCIEKKLIIELDGEIHNSIESKEYDEVRDKYFVDLGYKVLRFRNSEVEQSIMSVLEKIKSNV